MIEGKSAATIFHQQLQIKIHTPTHNTNYQKWGAGSSILGKGDYVVKRCLKQEAQCSQRRAITPKPTLTKDY
jgi:hypothetical protein